MLTLAIYTDRAVLETSAGTATLTGPTGKARFGGWLHANFYTEVGEPLKYTDRTVYFYRKGMDAAVGNGHHEGA